jgi:hypothetical protein
VISVADDIRLGYFLEDVGQEAFLVALVERVAKEVGLASGDLDHDPRNVVGGKGTAVSELRFFLRDVQSGYERPFDVLIVAIDSNCQQYVEKRNEILAVVERTGYPGTVVCAIPDPHIERWYLADPQSLRKVIGADIQPKVPTYKCERGRYKYALREAFRQADILAPLGGTEYGSEVATALDLYSVGKVDTAFKHFVDELRAALNLLIGME